MFGLALIIVCFPFFPSQSFIVSTSHGELQLSPIDTRVTSQRVLQRPSGSIFSATSRGSLGSSGLSTQLQSEIMREFSCSTSESITFRALDAVIERELVDAHCEECREGSG